MNIPSQRRNLVASGIQIPSWKDQWYEVVHRRISGCLNGNLRGGQYEAEQS